jgi:DNA repair protein RecO (recombination protein O)
MLNHESEAVVLRQYPLSEADRIVVFFTREYGKIRAVAQGAKRLKSRMGGCLEPLNHIHLRFYLKEGGDLARVRQCEIIHSYLGRSPSLERVYAFSYLAELVHELSQENYPNQLLFRLFLSVLEAGSKVGPGEGLIRYFELWSLRLNGLLPDYEYCSSCGRGVRDEGFFALLEAGQVRCSPCARGSGLHIRSAAAQLLHRMSKLSPEQFAALPWEAPSGRDLERLTQGLLELHIEKKLKSYPLLRQSNFIGRFE